ncbi:MAG TPA: DUF1653 domain-containing protein [Candidatus Saccharimonadales bacterium]|nr:DUF1653 domain-containing protein [Candidatus Saccharimonadales bacterium]
MVGEYPKFRAGIYKHYKGPLYLVLGLAHDANDEQRTAVVYIGLELDQAKAGPRLAVRTYEDFYAWVDPATGEELNRNNSKAIPRFKYIGQTLKK